MQSQITVSSLSGPSNLIPLQSWFRNRSTGWMWVVLLWTWWSAASVYAQSIVPWLPIPKELKKAYSVYSDTKKLYTNTHKCVERGGTEKDCQALALFCYIQSKVISKSYPYFVKYFQLLDAFKLDCGDGICYQCCYVPNKGCHTSFVGFPVINCNPNYGAGTRDAGLTMVVSPNAKPGDACLTTPQTCEHIPLCNYTPNADIAGLEQKLAQGTPHALNWQRSVNQRARQFAEDLYKRWLAYLINFHTEKDSLRSLLDTITGRGCKQWDINVTSQYPFDWSDALFEVKDDKGNVSSQASHLNGLMQLSAIRLVASIPNIDKRLASVDSRVWTEASKKKYLSAVKDPDEELLRWISPHILDVLKQNTKIQDYQLLAIPLPGEPTPDTFNGCELGQAPLIMLRFTQDGSHGVELTVELLDTGEGSPSFKTPRPLLFLWGDGQVESMTFPANTTSHTIKHTYTKGGRYLTYAIVQNEHGLRGISGLVVETSATTASSPQAIIPNLARVRLEKLQGWVATLSGNTAKRQFELWAEDTQKNSHLVGLSPTLEMKFNTANDFGDLVGHNTSGKDITKLVIRTASVGGFTIGLREKFFTVSQLSFEIYNTEKDAYTSHVVKLTPAMIKVYEPGSQTPLDAKSLTTDANGLIKIPIVSRINNQSITYDRVEIPLDPSMFSGFSPGPVQQQPWKAGATASWQETRPEYLAYVPVCGNGVKEDGETCDDGNRKNGDGCSSTCQLESPPQEPSPETSTEKPITPDTQETTAEKPSTPDATAESTKEPSSGSDPVPTEPSTESLTTESTNLSESSSTADTSVDSPPQADGAENKTGCGCSGFPGTSFLSWLLFCCILGVVLYRRK